MGFLVEVLRTEIHDRDSGNKREGARIQRMAINLLWRRVGGCNFIYRRRRNEWLQEKREKELLERKMGVCKGVCIKNTFSPSDVVKTTFPQKNPQNTL